MSKAKVDDADDFIEINGVDGSVNQWRQTFGPLLRLHTPRTQPLYEFPLNDNVSYMTLQEAARASETTWAKVAKVTGNVLEPDMRVRPMTDEEIGRYEELADDWAAEK